MTLPEARVRFPPIWVIYDRPADYPDNFVVRVWYGLHPEPHCWLFESLQQARDHIEREGGSVRLDRGAADEIVIVETWL